MQVRPSYRVPLAIAATGMLLASMAQAQDVAIRTAVAPASIPEAQITELARTPEVLILISPDVLVSEDWDSFRTFTLAIFQALQADVSLRLGVIREGSVDLAGPFRSVQEVRALLRKSPFDAPSPGPPAAASFMAGVATSLRSLPSEWGYTLIAGHIPQFADGTDPEVEKYAIAWLTRQFIAQRRSLLFWDPLGIPVTAWAQALSRNTGGFVFQQPAELAQNLLAQQTLTGVTTGLQPPASGFRLDSIQVAGVSMPVIASRNTAIPPIGQFAELRSLTGRIKSTLSNRNAGSSELAAARAGLEKALSINPADWTAVSLGISLTDQQKDVAAEIPLLQEAVELQPADANLWLTLGNLEYDRNDLASAETNLLQARKLGVKGARIAEQLGRIRYASQDYVHAEPLIDESLSLDPGQQPLWFVAAEIAKAGGNSDKQAQSLEKALALGGLHIEERTQLIRLYLMNGNKAGAARNADIELPNLPGDATVQTNWAQFYEQLARPADALARWSEVARINPRGESAHSAITAILLDQKRYSEALDAAGRGLESVADSPRLQLGKAVALERLDRVYEARQALDLFAPKTGDIELLLYQAKLSDTFGGNAPAAYRHLAEVLAASDAQSAGLRPAIERGLKVSLRDGDTAGASWFAAKLSGKSEAAKNADTTPNGIWIPGGFDALMFMARGPGASLPERFVLDYCRTVVAHESDLASAVTKLYRESMSEYFSQLKTLLGMAVRTGDKSVLTLSISNKKDEKQTEAVLDLLGWKLRRNKQELTVESNEKDSQARKQDLSAALAIDQGGMQSAFRAGKPFRIEIPWEWAPLAMDEPLLRQLAQSDKLAGGLPEALVANVDLARFYTGMSNLDRETAAVLMSSFNVNVLATRLSTLFAFYSSSLAVAGGRVLAPGGPAADPVWAALAGVAPSDPVRFIRALFNGDDGRLLAFFNALSQIDAAHQRFFTLSPRRATSFYKLFTQSEEARSGVGKRRRKGSFAEFLSDVPLNDDGSVDFPGSAEVWMVAKGGSKTADQSQKLLRKVQKAVAPDVEDEILLRMASTRYKVGADQVSELDNFLAVAHIDAHRSDPLDEESALLLAQNLTGYGSFYPYFSVFTSLDAADFRTVFSLGARLTSLDHLDADLAMGQFFSAVELLHLGFTFGQLPEPRATALFRSVCTRFLAAQGPADFTAAALDSVRELTSSNGDADQALARLVLGERAPVDVEWNGVARSLDPARLRAIAYGKVLNLQKTPAISALLRIDNAARSLAAQKGPADPLIAELLKDTTALPVLDLPKNQKFEGKSKEAIERYNTGKLVATVTELREKAQRRKVNPKDFEKAARDILIEIGPQVRLALTGIVYGAYLDPEDTLAANDPLLLRKHQSFDLRSTASSKPAFEQSALVVGSSGLGSFFVGGFAFFTHAAGDAAGLNVRKGNADAELYAQQIAATRMTGWAGYRDEDQRLLGLRIRLAREWLVYATAQPALLRDVSEDTLGILSLSRRRELLNAIASADWKAVWNSVTLSDLLFLGGRYAARYKQSPWNSPVDAALREASVHNDGSRLNLLGAVPVGLYGCDHPHLAPLAPYEEYERRLFPVELAERAAEMKLYLSVLLDKMGLPAAALPALAEPATRIAFSSIHMSDGYDWAQALSVFRAMDEKTVEAALAAVQ
jgi:Flp pilus assembly protein TadD